MLNRIYIVVGVFAIVVLAAAFIVPRFIQWGDYRDRMEVLSSDLLGAEVTIRGDISFSLLPTPRLEFTDVVVGDAEAPVATVDHVEAEFALLDFLRDIYTVTALSLDSPVVNVVVDENGLFGSGLDLASTSSGLSLNQARIANGTIKLEDVRGAETYSLARIDGELRLASFSGPFQFQGNADYGDTRYDVRVNSGLADAAGNAKLSSFIRQSAGAFSLNLDGTLSAGAAPKFDGTMAYRQTPPAADAAGDIRGALVLESAVSASMDRVVLSGYTLYPDENRAGTRLTGTASIQLGADPAFDAVISGGALTLPPRNANEVPAQLPYEAVRLLAELPAPPIPPIKGKLGVELGEIGLRGAALRDVRVTATSDGTEWTIGQAQATLPGQTQLKLSGTLQNNAGRPGFSGDMSLASQRLDSLSALWRKPQDDNPLFNMPGAIQGRLLLAGDAFGLTNGRLNFAGQSHGVEVRIGFGAEPRLDTVLHLGTLDAAQTAAFTALLPDIAAEPSFGISFPDGSFALTAQSIDALGLPATNLVAEAQWSPAALRFSRLSANDWGGLKLNTAVRLAGSLTAPRITGSGTISVTDPDAAALTALYEMAGVPFGWQQSLAGLWPADLQVGLADKDEGAGQILTLNGTANGAKLDLRADMDKGLPSLASANLQLVASLDATDGAAVLEHFGLGDTPPFSGQGNFLASLFIDGSGPQGFDGRFAVTQGDQSLSYFGNLRFAQNGDVGGDGTLDLKVDDLSGLAALVGVRGATLPALEGSGALSFDGLRSMSLKNISGASGVVGVTGSLAMQGLGQSPTFSGQLALDSLDATGLAGAVLGGQALIGATDAAWPEGPLASSAETRPSRGSIDITAQKVTAGGADRLGPSSFTYSWSADRIAIERFQAAVGGGTLSFNVENCCAGTLANRTLKGRIALDNVEIAALAPADIASGLAGRITAGTEFEGTGASFAEVMRAMTGQGNFSIASLSASGLSGGVFPAIAGIDDVLNTDADALQTLISLSLSQGNFTADEARGAFTIAGGTMRIANLIIDGAGAQLAGSLNIALATLGLDGSFALTPRDFTDASGLVQPDTARIIARIAGTVLAPAITVDLSDMVAAIQVRANELEVDRLEQLRLQDEARQRAAAEERNRLVEQQRQAAEAARQAAEEAARQQQLQQQQQQQLQQQQPAPTQSPFTLSLPNQFIGNQVNQPATTTPGQ